MGDLQGYFCMQNEKVLSNNNGGETNNNLAESSHEKGERLASDLGDTEDYLPQAYYPYGNLGK